ncbi:MAG: PilW family protein [Polaromonas sp.]|nr:PilW family protein [Polaromonas sp.]
MKKSRHQLGTTLVEWMVSIAIGLILLVGLVVMFSEQSKAQSELEKSSRQIENGRYAMQLLNDDLQMAGYYGEFSGSLAVPGTLPDPCSTASTDLDAAMAFSVQGYAAPVTTAELPSCINSANHVPGTDVLVIRRADATALTLAQAAAADPKGQVYLQSGLSVAGQLSKQMGPGTTATTAVFNLKTMAKPATPTTAAIAAQSAPLRKFLVHIYFVSPCSVMSGSTCTSTSDGGTPIPTLKMVELAASGTNTTMTTTPLVEGIERMQIDYGLDTTSDGAPDSYARTTADWANVMAVQVYLLARNNETSSGYLDKKSYNLGLVGMAAAPSSTSAASAAIALTGNQFKRKVFSQQIRLINPSSRRDQ